MLRQVDIKKVDEDDEIDLKLNKKDDIWHDDDENKYENFD